VAIFSPLHQISKLAKILAKRGAFVKGKVLESMVVQNKASFTAGCLPMAMVQSLKYCRYLKHSLSIRC
jgi:hypothetical protein